MNNNAINTWKITDGDVPNPQRPPGGIDFVSVGRASPASLGRLLDEHPNIRITVAPDRTKRTWHSPQMINEKLEWRLRELPSPSGPPAPEDFVEYVQVKCAPLPSRSRAHNGRMNQCAGCGADLRNSKAPLCIPCLAEALGTPLPPLALRHFQVSRMSDNGWTLEVNRCCTDGVANGCSMLYRAAWRAAKAMGYTKLITYTLPEEGGGSLKGAGFRLVGERVGGKWTRASRPRVDTHPTQTKWLWELQDAEQPNDQVSDGSQPPMMFDLCLS